VYPSRNETMCCFNSSVDGMAAPSWPLMFPRHDETFVVEPQTLVFLQHVGGVFQIVSGGDHRLEPLVLDLRDVDRVVPGREQCRRADALLYLARQRMHLVAEHGLRVRARDEIIVTSVPAELFAEHLDELVPVDFDRPRARPHPPDQLARRILPVRLYSKQAPAGTETSY